MSNRARSAALTLAVALWGAAASAGEVLLGLGLEGIGETADASPSVALDLRSEPLLTFDWIAFGLGAAAQIDGEADVWAGAGPFAYVPVTDRFRVEASAMPGFYGRGDGEDLGDDLLFRLQLGASYAVAPRWRAGAYLEHKSNAYTAEINPGTESVFLRIGRSF